MLSLKTGRRSSRASRFDKGGAARRARNIGLSAFLMLLILVGAGLAYTWYVGRNTKLVVEDVVPNKKTVEPHERPKRLAPDAAVGVSVQMITSPITPGMNAMVTIKTNPLATCKISVIYNNVPSTDSGLAEKKADDYGVATWTWTVPKETPLGAWPVKVDCANEKKSGTVTTNLTLVKELPDPNATN